MAANGKRPELHASLNPDEDLTKTPEAFELVRALIYSLRSSRPKPLKKLRELTGTQPKKFEMRPVWGANLSFVDNTELKSRPNRECFVFGFESSLGVKQRGRIMGPIRTHGASWI
jgi:hypothetical protein